MKTLSLDEAEKVLAPFFYLIATSIEGGFNDFLNLQTMQNENGRYVEYETHTKASIVHDCTKSHIIQHFDGLPKVKVGVFNRIFGLCITDVAFIRFKKFNSDLSTSNILTEQTRLYNQQAQIDGLPDAPTYLYAGYKPNVTWTGLEEIFIINRINEVIIWQISLTKYSTEQVVIPFSAQENSRESRVKIKSELQNQRRSS